jgi:hypothetical protein
MKGRFCRVEPLNAVRHASELNEAFADAGSDYWLPNPTHQAIFFECLLLFVDAVLDAS